MSKELFRINDIIISTIQYNPIISRYYKILAIIDNDEINHSEYYIITGEGDKNSKVIIRSRIIGEENNLNLLEIESSETRDFNPHDIHIRNPYKMIEDANTKIYHLKNRINFFEKNKNVVDTREEKLCKLIK